MKAFTKLGLQTLRDDMDAALAAVGKKHGLKIIAGSCRFSEHVATYKVECALIGADGVAVTKVAETFLSDCEYLGLKKTDLHAKVMLGRDVFRIEGLASRSGRGGRRVIVHRDSDGVAYTYPLNSVLKALGRPQHGQVVNMAG